MPVDDAPDDDDTRETYNFAPGYHGLVYRADVPDYGASGRAQQDEEEGENNAGNTAPHAGGAVAEAPGETRYKLQAMKWGLIPFWTKRNPDYGSVMKTINARDDSLASKGGMWQTMKQKKRCIVIAQGFYEWLKKNGGKEKIPHYVKRKDDQLMCFAGLWDCVKYEGSDEKHYTYTIITTDVNKQLSFLHDRMPVILENDSDQIRTWLDPQRDEWSTELQSLLKPFSGELDCYAVSKDVGKVGNNSPSFIIPVASSENKNNIANFFSAAQKKSKTGKDPQDGKMPGQDSKKAAEIEQEARLKVEASETEDNAPRPEPIKAGLKRSPEPSQDSPKAKLAKKGSPPSPNKAIHQSPVKKARNAMSNNTVKKSPSKVDGSQKISDFFKP